MISGDKIKEIESLALRIRKHIIEMICAAGSGHPGGSLSAADIITVLYFYKMKHNPKEPNWPDRDRFVMSKGHAAPVLYSALAEAGYFPISYLKTLRSVGSSLQGHIDMLSLPGIEMSTGSLGQGLSAANGMALAGKLDKKNYRVYCMIGDGESQEGQIWEAAMTSGHRKLDNLTAILDNNKYQIDGKVEDIKGIEPIEDKFKAFRWNVIKCSGHDIKSIISAFEEAEKTKNKPTMIIADTIKGKGVSFMEANPKDFHGRAPTKEEKQTAIEALCKLENL
ncbi:MAG: transketolase [Candidatus Saganbacteria bacterium]|uniref:Transketolase n=1 Tax=Candidatus Saganbacteria bacterium TaxID=2575572 RepID=A0A833NYI4_UNCSA|nr:MAG: transketolase [Candidatus Saganbacteria bacterium]